MPTISAVGVARPSAHGHAMMSTATAAVNAVASGVAVGHQQPGDEGEGGQHDDGRHEPGGDAVGQALDFGLALLRLLDQPHHLGQRGVRADGGGPDDETARCVDRRAGHLVPGLNRHGYGLAGQHRLVDGRRAVDDDAVGGDLLARADDELVADVSGRAGWPARCRREGR